MGAIRCIWYLFVAQFMKNDKKNKIKTALNKKCFPVSIQVFYVKPIEESISVKLLRNFLQFLQSL